MNSLREIQHRCYRAFLYEETSQVVPDLVSNEIPAPARVQVYQNNAREAFRKTLAAAYPVIERLVGEDCLRGLALRYMREHRSVSGDLQGFGVAFPTFLAEIYGDTDYAYLPDVAALEWAFESVQLERESEPMDLERLRKIASEDHPRLRFELSTGTRLVSSPYPILAIWRANQPGNDATVDLSTGPEHVAVLRRGDDVEMHLLSAEAFALAREIQNGRSLGEACDALDDRELDLGRSLQSLITSGLLTGFSVAR